MKTKKLILIFFIALICFSGYSQTYSDYSNVAYASTGVAETSALLQGLVADWEMDETSGTAMIDSHTNGYNATIIGATLNEVGVIGGAYSFTGSNKATTAASSATIMGSTNPDFTLSGFVNMSSRNTSGSFVRHRLISLVRDVSTSTYVAVGVSLNGYAAFITREGETLSQWNYTSEVLALGSWYHIALTKNGNNYNLYLNGVNVSGNLVYNNTTQLGTSPIVVGNFSDSQYPINGKVDLVHIHDRALTPQEVSDLYNSGNGKSYEQMSTASLPTEQTFLSSADYYVSSSTGSDTNDGLTQETAWASLSKLSAETFSAGDTIAFKAGDSFEGDFTPPSSGTLGSPITFSAYGTGAKPKIYGSTEIAGWTLHSGNIYKATVGAAITQLFIDDVRMSNARFPNLGYATVTGTSSTTNITSTDLNGSIDYSGALVVGRVAGHRWRLKRSEVASSSSQTLTLGTAISPLAVNDGFFLMNKLDFLDTAGEWVYDSGTGTVYLWTENGDSPSNYTVRGSIYDRGIDLNYRQHITVENLDIRHQKIDGIRVRFSGGGVNIHDNTFADQELSAINVNAGSPTNITVDNNVISGQNSYGILIWTGSNMEITNNLISDVFLIEDFGLTRAEYGVGIDVSYSVGDYVVADNIIKDVGYNGMNINGTNVVAEYNYIENACLTTDDGGGIYANGVHTSPTDMIVRYNIIKNVESGALPWWTNNFGNGLYADDGTTNITFQHNTVIDASYYGIYLHHNQDMLVQNNTVFNAWVGYTVSEQLLADNNTVSNNIIMNDVTQPTINRLTNLYIGSATLLNADNNTYVDHLRATPFGRGGVNYDFAGWKAATGEDTNSTFDGVALGAGEVEEIFYNDTKTKKAFKLTGSYRDLDGNTMGSLLVLEPFTSKILIKE